MAVNWVDRVPTRANRVLITPENGGTPYYATVTRADEPSVVGTPVNAANLNAMQNAAGLTSNKTIYVATTGSDINEGTETSPFASISKALSIIPKNLNGYFVSINIAAGTYPENVIIRDFNCGALRITGRAGDTVTFSGLSIINSRYVEVNTISLHISNAHINIESSDVRVLSPFSASNGRYGVHVAFNSSVVFSSTVTVNNATSYAVVATMNSRIYLYHLLGGGNFVSVAAIHGSVVGIKANEDTSETKYQTTDGGRIYAGAQQSVLNY